MEVRYVALTAGVQELAAHLVVGDLGDENRDAGREESFKPLYDLGVDLLGVRVGAQPERAGVQQDDVRRFHLAFGGLRQSLVREVLAILGTYARRRHSRARGGAFLNGLLTKSPSITIRALTFFSICRTF